MVASKTNMPGAARFRKARGFYAKALSAAEAVVLREAMGISGLDEEIALLRLRLQQAVEAHPEDIELMFKGAALLSRLVATKFGLSKGDESDVSAAIDRAVASLQELKAEAEDE